MGVQVDKVIRGLECCIGYGIEDTPGCEDCPYNDMGDTCERIRPLYEDALALLKAQEPVEPKMMEFVDKGVTWEKYEVPTCGVCGALLGDALFCPMCGSEVKWDG